MRDWLRGHADDQCMEVVGASAFAAWIGVAASGLPCDLPIAQRHLLPRSELAVRALHRAFELDLPQTA